MIPDETLIADLKLSVRAKRCLYINFGLDTVGQARELTDKQLMSVENFGKKSLQEIRAVIGYKNEEAGWRSIETLPMDETPVLVWNGLSMHVAWIFLWDGDTPVWYTGEAIVDATHWMPLPAPPKADQSTGPAHPERA